MANHCYTSQAFRRCVEEMPGGAFAFVANTYSNLEDNIMPAVQKGWQLMGLIEGVHYVKDTRPPESWRRKCSVIVDDYKHVYSFWNGVLFSWDHWITLRCLPESL